MWECNFKNRKHGTKISIVKKLCRPVNPCYLLLTRPPHPSGSFTVTGRVHPLPSWSLTRFCHASLPELSRFGVRWARWILLTSSCPLRLKPQNLDFVMTIGFWICGRMIILFLATIYNNFPCMSLRTPVCDDKSGYDHILLTPSSRTYFGFKWNGWIFTSNTIPLSWSYRPLCITLCYISYKLR